MANTSYAFGTVQIISQSKEDNAFIAKTIFSKTETWYYGTFLNDFGISEAYNENGHWINEYPFFGFGRWTYDNNIKYLGAWLSDKDGVSEEDMTKLKQIPFTLEFTYTDDECGYRILYQNQDILQHDADTELQDMKYFCIQHTDIEYTPQNLREFCDIGDEEIWENFGCFEYESRINNLDELAAASNKEEYNLLIKKKVPNREAAEEKYLELAVQKYKKDESLYNPYNGKNTDEEIISQMLSDKFPVSDIKFALERHSPIGAYSLENYIKF